MSLRQVELKDLHKEDHVKIMVNWNQSKLIQEDLLTRDVDWFDGVNKVKYLQTPYLFLGRVIKTGKKTLGYSYNSGYFNTGCDLEHIRVVFPCTKTYALLELVTQHQIKIYLPDVRGRKILSIYLLRMGFIRVEIGNIQISNYIYIHRNKEFSMDRVKLEPIKYSEVNTNLKGK